MLRRTSSYIIVDVDRSTDPMIVYIEDCNGLVSVTNDAENIFRKLSHNYGKSIRVVYLDTNNEWWEMYYGESDNWMSLGKKVMQFKRWHGKMWDVLSK